MSRSTRRTITIGTASATVLGAVAGYVDAVCFARLFAVFPANQSGNAIFFGIALGDASWSRAWRPAAAMVGFVVGVGLAAWVAKKVPSGWRARVLLGVELILLASVALDVGDVSDVHQVLTGWHAAGLLLATSVAMGVQTEVIRSHAGVAISTTYETGALAHVAEHVVDATSDGPDRRAHHGTAVAVLLFVLAGYIGGAAIGALLTVHWGGVLIVPLVVLGLLLLLAPWWQPAVDAPTTATTTTS